MDTFTFTGIITKEELGFTALCPEIDVASQGTTMDEAKTMLLEAATLHIEGAIEDGLPYLRPIPAEADPRRIDPAHVALVFRFNVVVAVNAYA